MHFPKILLALISCTVFQVCPDQTLPVSGEVPKPARLSHQDSIVITDFDKHPEKIAAHRTRIEKMLKTAL